MVLFASLLVGVLHFNIQGGNISRQFVPYKISPEKELENTSCWITSAEDLYPDVLSDKTPRNNTLPIWLPFADKRELTKIKK